ncbi:hypothetical protein A4A49_54847 [Nicotiana attenuata]|uniref:Uncharacterized protein n=1 Tax=Nicotiana attenuata TaxID=49451 RepID=A0A1J6KY79_NICAT|nr:hypothetical protein A4A49_54847 [Nicotiana attenuata]
MAKIMGRMRSFGAREKNSTTHSYSDSYVRFNDMQEKDDQAIRKGYIPVIVGNEEEMERVMIPMKLMKHPCIVTLLDISALELGYNQPGALRIHCQVEHFKRMLHTMSKRK